MQPTQITPPSLPFDGLELSLIAPICNEQENLRALAESVTNALGASPSWELLLVDDGSTDGSRAIIRQLETENANVRGVYFAHNCGQTAAIAAGIQKARGELIATIDGDLQNDPADLPTMIAMLRGDASIDGVVGWRQKRNDNFVRRVSSRIANAVRNKISGDSIRDTGCSLKVFRQEALRSITLFEGMHRFLPTLVRYRGFRVIEHPVSHHARTAGTSKYGVRNRAWRAFKDLLAVRWMRGRLITLPLVELPPHRPQIEQPAAPLSTVTLTPHPAPRKSSVRAKQHTE